MNDHDDTAPQAQRPDGTYSAAIPLPFYGRIHGRRRLLGRRAVSCGHPGCGTEFVGRDREDQYRLHYSVEHVPPALWP